MTLSMLHREQNDNRKMVVAGRNREIPASPQGEYISVAGLKKDAWTQGGPPLEVQAKRN